MGYMRLRQRDDLQQPNCISCCLVNSCEESSAAELIGSWRLLGEAYMQPVQAYAQNSAERSIKRKLAHLAKFPQLGHSKFRLAADTPSSDHLCGAQS